MKKVILYIDTTDSSVTKLSLDIDGVLHEQVGAGDRRSQSVLAVLVDLLGKQNLQLSQVTGIEVAVGPGSYTGIRVGAVIGLFLSQLLQVPLNQAAPGTLPQLQYL